MELVAPNISVILGTSVGARILAKAGSLKRLAMMPASTIQILGAEKALFPITQNWRPATKTWFVVSASI